jgi:hypothetical protein
VSSVTKMGEMTLTTLWMIWIQQVVLAPNVSAGRFSRRGNGLGMASG